MAPATPPASRLARLAAVSAATAALLLGALAPAADARPQFHMTNFACEGAPSQAYITGFRNIHKNTTFATWGRPGTPVAPIPYVGTDYGRSRVRIVSYITGQPAGDEGTGTVIVQRAARGSHPVVACTRLEPDSATRTTVELQFLSPVPEPPQWPLPSAS